LACHRCEKSGFSGANEIAGFRRRISRVVWCKHTAYPVSPNVIFYIRAVFVSGVLISTDCVVHQICVGTFPQQAEEPVYSAPTRILYRHLVQEGTRLGVLRAVMHRVPVCAHSVELSTSSGCATNPDYHV